MADRPVPASLLQAGLVDQQGKPFTLGSLRGRTVLLLPFMTLCTEMCPLDTANLSQVRHALGRSGVANQVAIVELSIDPGRDTPQRLAAYAQLTGVRWTLATGPPATIGAFEHFFGWLAQKIPEPSPPAIDYLTHQPLTYDILHSDGFAVLDGSGHERFATGAPASFHGTLPRPLYRFLDPLGRQNLAKPAANAWTPAEAVGVLGWVLRRPLPAPTT